MESHKLEDCRRFKWSASATNLLISIWSHNLVQKQLISSTRNHTIWQSVAKYMSRKGFPVTGLQCKTRIKNMLCSYHEAIRKNEPISLSIKPYIEIFKKVLIKKNIKKKAESKFVKYVKETASPEEINESEYTEETLNSNSFEVESSNSTSNTSIEFSEGCGGDSQVNKILGNKDTIKIFENVILKAVNLHTEAIVSAISKHSKMIEKLIAAESEKLISLLSLERESRKQLDIQVNSILSRFEKNSLPEVTYVNKLMETSQNN